MFIGITDKDMGEVTINVNKIVSFWPVEMRFHHNCTIELEGDKMYKAKETVDDVKQKISDCMLAKARILNLLST